MQTIFKFVAIAKLWRLFLLRFFCYIAAMVITYFGKSYFKLTLGDLTIAINPPSKDSKSFPKPPRFGADIALITTNHPDYNGADQVSLGSAEPFVIDGPGSYEVKDVYISGALSKVIIENPLSPKGSSEAKKEYINTVYGFEIDNIKCAFMGIISDETTLSVEAKDILRGADILFVPIGGVITLDPAHAYKIAVAYDPSIIIPYHYDTDALKRFLKEGGQEKNEAADKATLKRKDLEGKEGYILVLDSQA